jgi:hypothetical protein
VPDPKDAQLQEVAILTRAVENVFRKLIRFLVGRISLVKLQEMISYIYVQEAESKLKIETPTRRASLTRLAVLTGIDTRTLIKITNSSEYLLPVHEGERFLKELTPESCIIELWTSDSRFLNRDSGKPNDLTISGAIDSFENLVQEVITPRGVTMASLLDRLEQNEIIKIDRDKNKVSLQEFKDAPYKHGEAVRALELGLASCVILLDTVFYNYRAIQNGQETRYQRGCWTNRLSPKKRLQFEKRLKVLLEEADDMLRNEMLVYEEKQNSQDQITAGIGMFYFEDIPKNFFKKL